MNQIYYILSSKVCGYTANLFSAFYAMDMDRFQYAFASAQDVVDISKFRD